MRTAAARRIRFISLVAVSITALLGTRLADAAVIATDDFNYPDGTLWGAGGGTGWLSYWTGNGMDVASGMAVTNLIGNPPKYGSRPFINPQTTGELFVSFDLTTGAIDVNDYFGALLFSGVNNNILGFGKQIGSNEFQVFNGGAASTGIGIQPNTSYHLVGAYAVTPGPATDRLLLWVNPDGGDFYNPSTGANTADAVSNELVAFHATNINLYGGTAGFGFDNLVISNTADGVGLAVVPLPAAIGLFAAGLLGVAATGRRRRNR